MTRPKLLFLSHRLPFPPHNGAAVRSFHLLQQLSREFDVVALCFDRADPALAHLELTSRIAGLSPYGRFESWPIDQLHSPVRFGWDHVISVVSKRPYVHPMHHSKGFEKALERELRENQFDMVHLDTLDLMRFVPMVQHLPMACTHHNAESNLLFRRADRERGLRAWYMRHQARLLARAEADLLPRFDLNVTVSEVDAELLQEQSPTARFAVVPNGVDAEYFHPSSNGKRAGLVFVGGTTWFPNKDGLEWFSADVLPLMRSAGMRDTVTWVGRVSDAERAQFAHEGLRFTGYVDDIRPYVQSAACFIAPLRVGGGTRLKILDAWAMGVPVVATRIACEGLPATDGENVLFADDAESFVRATTRVLRDRGLAARIGAGGRALVQQAYGWDIVGERLRTLYLDVIGRRATSPPRRLAVAS